MEAPEHLYKSECTVQGHAQIMLMPDLHDRRGCNPNSLGHRTNGPVRCFLSRRLKRQRLDPLNEFAIKRRNAGSLLLSCNSRSTPSDMKRACQR